MFILKINSKFIIYIKYRNVLIQFKNNYIFYFRILKYGRNWTNSSIRNSSTGFHFITSVSYNTMSTKKKKS